MVYYDTLPTLHTFNQIGFNMAKSTSTPQFPFFPLLTLLFIALKLTGVITWSWFWVLSPMLIPFGLLVFAGVLLLIAYAVEYKVFK